MKMLLVALGILLGLPVWAEASPEGEVVHTATYTGVIFTPAMMATSDGGPIDSKIVKYWTPSRELIKKAEQSFYQAVTKAQAKTPPEGFHFQEYYTPKHFSRDRERPLPEDATTNPFYNWTPKELESVYLRQYIGVTIDGKKAVLISLFEMNEFLGSFAWKSSWLMMCPSPPMFFYVPQTGELSEWPFSVH